MSEDEEILRIRYSRMTWKQWAAIFAAGALTYFFISTIQSMG